MIQVIYLSLAILMGGGLVLFGIGGNTSGGLVDAIQGNSGGSDPDDAFDQRVQSLEKRIKANPQDAQALAQLASLRFQVATTGENYDTASQAYTTKGKAELRQSTAAWQRYLALDPEKPDATVANQMVQAYGVSGLQQYPDAVQAMEIVIDNRDATYQLYAQLAVLAHAAKQDRKSTLAAEKAVELAPKAQRKDIRQQIDLAKTQLDNAARAGTPEGQ